MEFEKRKKAALESINKAEPDKSPKGNIDTPIIPLLNTLNSHPSFFTTSSCSGRISILSQPITTITTTTKKKAKGGTWLFITHDLADPLSLLNHIFPTNSTHPPPIQPHSLVFRFEPLIIAVECLDVKSAQFLVSLAISCGFRESGITSVNKRVIVAIRCSIRLEVPLGDTRKIMVSPEYVKYLVEIANEKMEANRRRTDNFLTALLSNGFQGPDISVNEKILVNAEAYTKNGSMFNEAQNLEGGLNSSSNGKEEDINFRRRDDDTYRGSLGIPPGSSLSIVKMAIVGEPLERLYLWGHTACVLHKKVIIFGGFGGIGSHARRNDSLILDPICGKLEAVNVQGPPSPRLGHTSTVVGDSMFVIGGRAGPTNILNDVWVLEAAKSQWRLLPCTGCAFPPRHRHVAAVVGSKIYVFGGIHDDVISSSLYVFDTHNLEWNKIPIQGEWPCARHSHSLVSNGCRLFMFGGYDGEKVLGDLYSFDVQTCLWKEEKTGGGTPYARFSHSMFVYKNYIGIIGGCPIRQHYQELSLLDLRYSLWKHVKVNSIGEDLFVRSTASVVGDDIVMIGGGASCYAFGTKFSEPMKLSLLPLLALADSSMPGRTGNKHIIDQNGGMIETNAVSVEFTPKRIEENANGCPNSNLEIEELSTNAGDQIDAPYMVLQLERKYAKLGKDILKKFGWLDPERKVYTLEGGSHICFPVTGNFCSVFNQSQLGDAFKKLGDLNLSNPLSPKGILSKDMSFSSALNLLMACGATKIADEVVKFRRTPISPLRRMSEAVASLMNHRGLPEQYLEQLPSRWERLGDIVVLSAASFKDPIWDSIGEELWPTVAKSLGTRRLARQGRVAPSGTRDSTLEILVGNNGWVDHRENGIIYSFDATKCMFSWGNLSEKLRMGRLDCRDDVIVDLFAGIGYFTLPFLVRANAKLVYACEWNPHAVEALQRNLHANSVADRCIILEGDNQVTAPKGVADRVCLGLLPTSEGSWVTAVRALRRKGGMLHVHGNVKDSEENVWTAHVSKSIYEIAQSEGYNWDVKVEHVERVKWYAPHVRHLVVDIKCK
ncbi:hypothetical protein LguiB_005162 [Lonicera macranthoides]